VVGGDYDPMLAKYIAHAPTRTAALHRLRTALADTRILGVTTNLGFLHDLLGDPEVIAGHLDTGLVERHLAAHPADPLPREVLVAAALERALDLEPNDPVTDPWDIPGGWRIGESAWATWRIDPGAVDIRIRGRAHDAEVAIAEGDPVPAAGHWDGGDPGRAAGRWDGGDLVITVDGRTLRYGAVRDGAELWLTRNGRTWRLTETGRLAARTGRATADGPVTSPMPGTVLAVNVTKGDTVSAGQNLVVVEAMKMEHTVTAPAPGTVDAVHVHPGDRVTLGQHLVTLEAQP
jgi:acetyl-CoA/propionyl-CoA carboxylase biotin carboxyl carrier protein